MLKIVEKLKLCKENMGSTPLIYWQDLSFQHQNLEQRLF